MTRAVAPPAHDPLAGELVPEADSHRAYGALVTALMEVWDCSKPAAERKMESYSLAQCETLVRERWGAV
jgi:hypothetical protein